MRRRNPHLPFLEYAVVNNSTLFTCSGWLLAFMWDCWVPVILRLCVVISFFFFFLIQYLCAGYTYGEECSYINRCMYSTIIQQCQVVKWHHLISTSVMTQVQDSEAKMVILLSLVAGLYARLAVLPETQPWHSIPPIPYTKRRWSISSSGWGDAGCKEYLRFTISDIEQLILHLRLSTWPNSRLAKFWHFCDVRSRCSWYIFDAETHKFGLIIHILAWEMRSNNICIFGGYILTLNTSSKIGGL